MKALLWQRFSKEKLLTGTINTTSPSQLEIGVHNVNTKRSLLLLNLDVFWKALSTFSEFQNPQKSRALRIHIQFEAQLRIWMNEFASPLRFSSQLIEFIVWCDCKLILTFLILQVLHLSNSKVWKFGCSLNSKSKSEVRGSNCGVKMFKQYSIQIREFIVWCVRKLWLQKNLKNVMEFFYGSSNDNQASVVHSFDGNVSPINAQNFIGQGRFYSGSKTPILDPYASSESTGSSSNIVSPLARYICPGSPVPFTTDSPKHRSLVNTSSGSRSSSGGRVSRSPLGSLENIEIPLVFRTPVKVEEDVVVMDGILVEPKHGPRAKLSPSTSASGGRLLSSTSGNDNSFHKSETCRWWEDFGSCRFGSKCRVSLFSFFSPFKEIWSKCLWNIRAVM